MSLKSKLINLLIYLTFLVFILDGCAGNVLPIFISSPIRDARVNVEYSYEVKAIVPKTGKQIAVKALGLPDWLNLESEGSGITKLVGTAEQVGTHLVTLMAENGGSESYQSFELIVKENSPPELFTRNSSVQLGTTYQQAIEVFDSDDDKVTIKGLNIPPELLCFPSIDECNTLIGTFTKEGNYIIVLSLSDGFLEQEVSFEITVKNENSTPEITSVPEEKVVSGAEYRYIVQATDNNVGDLLVIKAVKKPDWLEFEDLGKGVGILKGTAGEEVIGEHEVILLVEDDHNPAASTTQEFMLEVTKPNSPPIFESLPNTNALEDNPYQYQIQVKDDDPEDTLQICPDDDSVSKCVIPTWLSLQDDGEGKAVLKSGDEVTKEQRGSHFIVLVATDSKVETKQNFTLVVSDANFAPAFIEIPLADAPEDKLYVGTVKVSDGDGPDKPVKISATINPPQGKSAEWLKFTDNKDNTATLEGTPTERDRGSYQVILKADDGKAITEQTITIVVGDVNKAPEFTQLPLADAPEDKAYKATITAIDEDGPTELAITAEVIPPTGKSNWLAFTDQGDGIAALEGTPSVDNRGTYQVVLRAFDGKATTEQVVAIVVSDINQTPSFIDSPNINATEDSLYSQDIRVEDPDDFPNALSVSASQKPDWLNVSFSNNIVKLSGTPKNEDVGQHGVVLKASDGKAEKELSFTLLVTNTNDSPVVDQDALDKAVAEGSLARNINKSSSNDPDYVYYVQPDTLAFLETSAFFTDPDKVYGDNLGFSATLEDGRTPLPSWFNLNESIGDLVGTFSNDINADPIGILVRARDNAGESVEIKFKLEHPFGTRQFGTRFDDSANHSAANLTGIYIVGSTRRGALEDPLGNTDAYIRKYNPDGAEEWTDQFGSFEFDTINHVILDATAIYVIGETNGNVVSGGIGSIGGTDGYARQYNFDGNVESTKQFGRIFNDDANHIVSNSTGIYVAYVIGGNTSGSFGDSTKIAKYSNPLKEVWNHDLFDKTGNTSVDDDATHVTSDSTSVYIAGRIGVIEDFPSIGSNYDAYIVKYDSDKNQVWKDQFGTDGSNEHIKDQVIWSKSLYIFGTTDDDLAGAHFGGQDVYIRKYNSANGNVEWTEQFGSSVIDFADNIIANSTGIYVTGLAGDLGAGSSSNSSPFIRKYDSSGNVKWTKQFGTGSDRITHITSDSTGIYIVGNTKGNLKGNNLGSQDAFIRKYDSDGNVQWTDQFGSSNQDETIHVIANPTGIYVTGHTDGDFEGNNLGDQDIFIRKYYPNGTYDGQRCDTTTNKATDTNPDGIFIYDNSTQETKCTKWTEW